MLSSRGKKYMYIWPSKREELCFAVFKQPAVITSNNLFNISFYSDSLQQSFSCSSFSGAVSISNISSYGCHFR